jgi:hypothetical protein
MWYEAVATSKAIIALMLFQVIIMSLVISALMCNVLHNSGKPLDSIVV